MLRRHNLSAIWLYTWIYSTKSPPSGASNIGETMLTPQVGKVRLVVLAQVCVPANRAVVVSVFVYLRTSRSQMTEEEGR
jgi:hypothetical protein